MKGYILAGGLSSRFGRDKALYPIEGVPLALRIAEVLRAAGLEPWLVARAPRALGLPELIEPEGPRHPLWGIAAGLAEGSDAFFTPCDLVDLSDAHVRALLAVGAIARGQPLLGVYPARLRTAAERGARDGDPVHTIVAGLPVLELGPLGNLNRPPAVRPPD